MNRNQIYNYLKEIEGMKSLFYKHGKGYHVKFVPEIWTKISEIWIGDIFIENFYSITLLIQEIIIEGETGDMEIHIKYKDIESFYVYIEEGYKIIK